MLTAVYFGARGSQGDFIFLYRENLDFTCLILKILKLFLSFLSHLHSIDYGTVKRKKCHSKMVGLEAT